MTRPSDALPPESDYTVDARELVCPLPVLKAQRQLRQMETGSILILLATDPASARDVPDFCREAGYDLLSQTEDHGVYRFHIRK